MDYPKLKKCPFCGNGAVFEKIGGDIWIECIACGSMTHKHFINPEHTHEQAIKLLGKNWNTRDI